MSELDDALKWLKTIDAPSGTRHSTARSSARILIAALEDRDRLRAAAQGIMGKRFVRGFEADAAWAELHAALKGRDG